MPEKKERSPEQIASSAVVGRLLQRGAERLAARERKAKRRVKTKTP